MEYNRARGIPPGGVGRTCPGTPDVVNRLIWVTVPLGVAFAAAGFFLFNEGSQAKAYSTDSWADLSKPRHPVTEQMKLDANSARGRTAKLFTLPDTDEKPQSLRAYLQAKPVLLVMTKEGCPCSIESQPYFNELARTYPEVQFLGVMDAGKEISRKYVADFKVPYPMLSETGWDTYRSYGTPRSVYVVLVGQDGKVRHMWPGYSGAMLLELGQALAKEAQVDPRPFDADRAPTKMTSGCQFHRNDGS